jgi:putative hydrolase
VAAPSSPVAALERTAYLLEAAAAPTYRVRAFRRAARAIAALGEGELALLAEQGRLTQIAGVGDVTAAIITEALSGATPLYLQRLEDEAAKRPPGPGEVLEATLLGDCHMHSDWSDGGASIEEMAAAAVALGRRYVVLSDHSPRLTVARGLSAERLLQQLGVVAGLNQELAPFRILTGIEVDILEDGSLDQTPDMLARLDVVVGSAHSLLRMEHDAMTRRMISAIEDPYLDILGHCTGRIVVGRGRPQSTFDAEAVFQACVAKDKAVEINSRPERQDPPDDLLMLARDLGCKFAINSDAHYPGQLSWLLLGAQRAAALDIGPERIVNALSADDLRAWAASHRESRVHA